MLKLFERAGCLINIAKRIFSVVVNNKDGKTFNVTIFKYFAYAYSCDGWKVEL